MEYPRTLDGALDLLREQIVPALVADGDPVPHGIRFTRPDQVDDINLIGPYPTAAERDAEMRRLAGLPGMGVVELVPSRTDRMCAGTPIPSDVVHAVTDAASFLAAGQIGGRR
jgi:hypothetical protein